VDCSEALEVEPFNIARHVSHLAADDRRRDSHGAGSVACQADVSGQVENDCYRQTSVASGIGDQLRAPHPVGIGRVDHGQAAALEPCPDPAMQLREHHVVGWCACHLRP
jgi:hypothetical protein